MNVCLIKHNCVNSILPVLSLSIARLGNSLSPKHTARTRLILKQCAYRQLRTLRHNRPVRVRGELRASSLFTSPSDTVDRYVDQITEVVTLVLDKFAPLRAGIHRAPKNSSSRLSKEVVDAKRERRRIERRWHVTKKDEDRVNCRRSAC
jgi:hypothetical protein